MSKLILDEVLDVRGERRAAVFSLAVAAWPARYPSA